MKPSASTWRPGCNDTLVTRRIDGLPQRVIVNEFVRGLEKAGPVSQFLLALRSAYSYRRKSGASTADVLRSAFALRHSERLTRTQVLMAANAAVFTRRALHDGRIAEGVIPSGQVAGLIDDVPTCAELVDRIVAEAEATLRRLR